MKNRVPIVAGNWKMFKTCQEAVETAGHLVQLLLDVSGVDVMIAPSFTALAPVSEALNEGNISLGAQNLFWEKEGAYTGEISASMLVSAGCRYVIIGHSERRQYFSEKDETVNKKIKTALNAHLIPIFCIGESASERESNRTFSVLDKQVKNGLYNLVSEDLEPMILAYEPVWAIGTGKTATSDQAQEVHQFLRSLLEKYFGKKFSQLIRILYGGSVKPDNISELMVMPDIDGVLVGGASLNADTFSKIVHHIGKSL